MAARLDGWLVGRRRRTLAGAALLCVAGGPLLDRWLEDAAEERASAALVLGFAAVAVVLVVGRVTTWRDDQQRWTRPRAVARARHLLALRRRALVRWWHARWSTKAASAGPGLLRLGIVVLASTKLSQLLRVSARQGLRGVADLLPALEPAVRASWGPFLKLRAAESQAAELAVGALMLGGALTVGAWLLRRGRVRALRRSLLTGALPPVLAHRDKAAVEVVRDHTDDPVLHAALTALHAWRPAKQRSEWAYQEDLERWLSDRLVGHTITTEQRIGSRAEGTYGRADVVVDDWLLVEMKRGLSAGEAQRAVGQLDQYLRAWSTKGAVLLVLCDVPLERARATFEPPVSRHHAAGHVVLVLTVQGR